MSRLAHRPRKPAIIKIGCCGFPRPLEAYARHLSVVEVQQTFYRLPRVQTAERWRSRVPPDFEFTMKAWQLITHRPTSPTYRHLGRKIPDDRHDRYGFFAPTEEVHEAWAQTLTIARALRAAVVVFQCPPSFTPTSAHVAHLGRFFASIERNGLRFAWEPRGAWPVSLVRPLCLDLDLIHCVDPFASRSRFGRLRYYRLHGRDGYRYRYTDADLSELRSMCSGVTYVLFNNISMWDDALRFRGVLDETP
jgi:uncharacterized protein YecE (DUF72 family)